MPKLEFKDLRYIVMEGGGARGNTYLGSVRAIENKFKDLVDETSSFPEFKTNENSSVRTRVTVSDTGTRPPGIMDYVEKLDEDTEQPYIRGVAGASAGAITTFALVLGLNSEEIEEVLEFDFVNFLSEKHVGKYRMIDAYSNLAVGEDHDKAIGGKSEVFDYELDKNRTEVKGNQIKAFKRGLIMNTAINVIVDGVTINLGRIVSAINRLTQSQENPGPVSRLINGFLTFLENNSTGLAGVGIRFAYHKLISFVLWQKLGGLAGFKLDANTVASVFADRGMFSGFQVREFFYDMILYAASRNTFFQRKLVEYFNEKEFKYRDGSSVKTAKFELTAADLKSKNKFKFGDRKSAGFSEKAIKLFKHLKDLTFLEFYEMLGVDYGAAVSNFTSNSPLYFSESWTPQFRVLESVAASMSIPPAIRPIYNDSDVAFETKREDIRRQTFPRTKQNWPIHVTVDGVQKEFVDSQGNFKKTDYELYELVVKKILQRELIERGEIANAQLDPDEPVLDAEGNTRKVYIDLNTLIEINTSLPKLRDLVVGRRVLANGTDRSKDEIGKDTLTNDTIAVNNKVYKINYNLLEFFYNAQFKGLFLDGGYFNNIPFNYFRDPLTNDIDGVFAIKLDGSFPPAFMDRVRGPMQAFINREKEINDKVDEELYNTNPRDLTADLTSKLETDAQSKIDVEYNALVDEISKEFQVYFIEQKEEIERKLGPEASPEQVLTEKAIDRHSVAKFIEEWMLEFGPSNRIKPWAKVKPIIAIAFEGYSYGSRRGQIRTLMDHDHIISSYDFGVDTYDFDLSQVRPLKKLAQDQAQKNVKAFFED